MPIDCKSSRASSSLNSASSASVLASRKIASAGATRSLNFLRSSPSFSSAASTLKTYKNGLAVNKCRSCKSSRSKPDEESGLPLCSCASAFLTASTTGAISLLVRASFSSRGSAFSIVCKSASASSVLIVSISLLGSMRPSTCTTSPSVKTRITWQIASVSRIFARNLFPRPAPSDAPFTIPAISTKDRAAGSSFSEEKMVASFARRSSGTPTTPTLGSIVAKG
ncbi:unannotated protein [freshwater metagenome]|uniref:Unannotated protein n=1 Tax=freshwater metagenome TaxID=449393 RepID=A0A6J7A6N8_9ZZZZ